MLEENSQQVKQDGDVADQSSTLTQSQLAQLQSIIVPSSSFDASIVYDSRKSQYIAGYKALESSEVQAQSEGPKIIVFDREGNKISSNSLNDMFAIEGKLGEDQKEISTDENEQKKQKIDQRFSDTYSILRFVKGFTLKIAKSQSKKGNEEELVLTNMAFTSGLHLWEIIAPISCNNLQVGVFNPVTNKEVLTSFKTTTMRVITVCLDLNENQLKFWLNDRRNPNKNMKLEDNGPWVPCVKISVERNKIILNPYAREPSDFYEKDFDKKFTLSKYLMPHLYNMICVAKLPKIDAQTKPSQQLKEYLMIQSQDVSQILMPQLLLDTDNENERFCFVQFNHYEQMGEFIRKNKNTMTIYEQHEIASWFTTIDIKEEVKEAYSVIRQQIQIPKGDQESALKQIEEAFQKLVVNKEFNLNQPNKNQNISIGQQPFTDKLIIGKDNQYKLVSRDISTLSFDLQQINLSESPVSLDAAANIKLKEKLLLVLITLINWSQIFKDNNDLVNGLILDFFKSLSSTAFKFNDYINFKVPLNTAKFTIEQFIQHMKSQLDRVKRQYQNYQTIIPSTSLINKNKPEQPLEKLKSYSFYRDPNLSIDEIYSILQILYDIHEQLYAQTKDFSCPPEVKNLLNSISKPYSAFNRLGSYITWGVNNVEIEKLAENGFYYKENQTLTQYENQAIEIQDLSAQTLFDRDILQEQYGSGNRFLNSLVTENIPLYKTLNYLPPVKLFNSNNQTETIASQNNDFVIFGNASGQLAICSSDFQLSVIKASHFFNLDLANKQKTYISLHQKIQSRFTAFEDYRRQNFKKLAIISLLKNFKGITKEQQKEAHKIQAEQNKQILKSKSIKKQPVPAKKAKPLKQKKKTNKQKIEEIEDAEIGNLFGEEPQPSESLFAQQNLEPATIQDSKVIGYFLLSKPAYEKVIDPIIVGCIYYSAKSAKYFIRIRLFTFAIQYLQSFIALDPVSGLQINKISGKQLLNTDDYGKLYEEILNHQDNIMDLYTLFMRNQVLKKDWIKKDQKFSVFNDVIISEIEIENCSKIIDFTKCSYSIENQDKLYLILENQEQKIQLVQYYIKTEAITEMQASKINISRGKELELENVPQRVFQYDHNLALVGSDFFQILNQESFKIELNEKLCYPLTKPVNATIVNQTKSNQIFNKYNLKKFNTLDKVPVQQWKLVISKEDNQSIHYYSLKLADYQGQQNEDIQKKQKVEKITDIELEKCEPNDILQIGNLLESKYEGLIAVQNNHSILSSSGQDQDSNLNIFHQWQIISNSEKEYTFEASLSEKGDSEKHLKSIELELSFKKKTSQPLNLQYKSEGHLLSEPRQDQDPQTLKRLPLIVEWYTGAQINDVIQPNFLTNPDSIVFSSNYPQPEFIFKHLGNKPFIPTSFIIKSKENREWNGIPISEGIIFVSESLDTLISTKQFSKFSEKEYNKWRQDRDKLSNIPLLPNEPVAYFNLQEKTEIVVSVDIQKPIRYVKFIPTAFRKKPINYSSKSFNSNQAECQFFGVDGYEVDQLHRGINNNRLDQLSEFIGDESLKLNIDAIINEKDLGLIGEIQNVTISQVRGPRPSNSLNPLLSLKELQVPSVIGVAKVQIALKEEHCGSINQLKLTIQNSGNALWELHGVQLSVKSYKDSSAIFGSEILQQNKPRLREYLLDPTRFSKLLKQLVDISQNSEIKHDDLKVASIQCIQNFLKNNQQDKNYNEFLKQFREHTDIQKILSDHFLNQSPKYQQLAQQYLDKIGLLKQNADFITDVFIKKQIDQLLDEARPIQKVKSVFELLSLCPQEKKSQLQQSLVDILVKRIGQEELPKYQTQEYITLRSKLNINSFPFDDVSLGSQNEQSQSSSSIETNEGTSQFLDCNMELYKYNTLYHFNFDLRHISFIDKIKLYFESDPKNLYKIGLKVIVPDDKGRESIFFSRIYDENYFSQLCEKAEKSEIYKYYSQQPGVQEGGEKQTHTNLEEHEKGSLDLNCLNLDLHGYIGRFFKIQIELLDTYRTVHKTHNITSLFIRPEVHGYVFDHREFTEDEISKLSAFKVRDHEKKNLIGSHHYHSNRTYQFYLIPENLLSPAYKSCVITVTQHSSQEISKEDQSEKKQKVGDNENVQSKLTNERQKLKELINDFTKKSVSKNSLRIKVNEVQKLAKNFKATEKTLNLKYLLNLSELLAGQILQALKTNPQLFNEYGTQDVYLLLFRRFSVYDQKSLYPNIQKILEQLFQNIEDKSKFVCSIFSEFLLKPEINYSQKNVIEFIQKQKDIDFNGLLTDFAQTMNLSSVDEATKVQDTEQINQVFRELTKFYQQDSVSIHQIIAILTIIDDLKINEAINPLSKLRIDLLLQIITKLITKCSHIKDSKNQQGGVALQYIYQVLNKFLNLKGVNIQQVITNSHEPLLKLTILSLIRNEKPIDKLQKELIKSLAQNDTLGELKGIISLLLSWYKNKENIRSSHYYSSLNVSDQGIFYKHLAMVFKYYVNLLKENKETGADQTLDNAYKDLDSLTNDLLNVLIADQDMPNYEENFFVVWIQIYKKTIAYLSQHSIQNQTMVDLLATQFYSLKPIYQEILYPRFHHINEKEIQSQVVKDPQQLITLLKAFLFKGFSDPQNLKIAYCYCDGLLNLIQSYQKEKSSQATISSKLNNQQIQDLSEILYQYLNNYCNLGVFTGILGSQVETIMRMDIGIQISSILVNADNRDNVNALTAYFQSKDENISQARLKIVDNLIQWLFLNNSSAKGKSSPAGSRIYTLSQNIETYLTKVSVSDSAVTECLPVLMKNVLTADYKLRDLCLENLINNERGVFLQKTINQLFLTFFKAWVNSDSVAKQFLTELNGFDFLLDRLFSKKEVTSSTDLNQYRKVIQAHNNDDILSASDSEGENVEDQDDDNQIMNLVLQKLNKQGATSTGSKPPASKPQTKKEHNKKNLKKLPTMMKQEAVKQESQAANFDESNETQMKEVEQKITVDDYAKNLQIIWSSDKQKSVSVSYSSVQWSKFKNGTKNRLYNYIIDQTHQYEYVMKFDLQNVIQLSEIQVGLLYNWSTYEPDCQHEPQTFILEGGKTEDVSDWKVLLTPINDDGFKMNSISVYGAAFTKPVEFKGGATLDKVIESIGIKQARYLTMRLRKPLMACLDQSQYVGCASKTKSYGISYISVMGNQVAKPTSLYSYLMDMQKENSLEILSKFFSGEFTEAFELISEQPQIITKIQNAFDKLSVLLDTKANLIKPIFLAICSKNKDLGDWIMMNRLISLNPEKIKKEQIKFLGDIISSNREKQLDKLFKLKTFILQQIANYNEFNEDQRDLLARYLKLFNTKLREYGQYVQNKSQEVAPEEIHLEFETTDLDNLVVLMSQCEDSTKGSKLFTALTSLALILLIPPAPFTNKTIQVDQYVEKLLLKENNQMENLLFCSIIATTNENAIQNILKNNKIEWLLEKIKQDTTSANEQLTNLMYQYAQILFNCSKQPEFRDKYRRTLTFELYELVKNKDEGGKLLRTDTLTQDTTVLIVQTINDLVIGGADEQEKLTNMLKADMIKASDVGDVEFINRVIVPILHAEEKVPITINILDKSQKGGHTDPIYVGSEAKVSKDNFFLKTNILNKKQKETFQKMFKEITADKVENFNRLINSKWEMIFEDKTHQQQDSTKFRKFVQAINNKQNIIILCGAKVLDQQMVFGGFTNKPFPSLGESWAHEFDYQVPFSEANFVCQYTQDKELHFTMTHNKPFGYIYTDYEEGGALSISGDFFLISWSYEFQNSCGNIYDMKCIEDPSAMSQYNNMEIQSIEIWWCNQGAKGQISDGKMKSELKKNQFYKKHSPFQFFRENLVFEVGKEMTLSHVAQEILGKQGVFIKYPTQESQDLTVKVKDLHSAITSSSKGDPILDLVILKEAQPAQDGEQIAQVQPVKDDSSAVVLKPAEHNQPLLKLFEEKGGIFDLIKAAKAAVDLYDHKKLKNMWGLWLSEIESFSQLPTFFSSFCQDHEKEAIIYDLLEGKNDIKGNNGNEGSSNAAELAENSKIIQSQWELHIEMVKYSYKIVSEVFDKLGSSQLRDECLKNGTFERFIDRIGQLSSEKKRTKIDKSQSISISEASSPEKGKEQSQKKKTIEQNDKQKRKGVGYTTGVGTTWNVSEYLKSKDAKNGQVANIVNILRSMIKSTEWQAPPEVKNLLLESALLPTLESAFRSGSLLDMAKDFELNMAYLGFVQELSNHSALIELLMDIGDEYEPRQKEPINVLLKKIGDLSKIFLDCLPADQKDKPNSDADETQQPRLLAEKILATNEIVKEKIREQALNKNQLSLADILALPLSDAYSLLLSDMRFEYMNIKNSSGIYNHAYVHDLPKGLNPPVTKLVRLAQEIADLSNSLPCDYTNAIFCRVDQERVDVMKCLIMGASGTPYGHGAFIYDLFFENNYPNGPPKCQLVTTGGQTVRFNPNLYNNGKVCLSLLGTWRGSSTENWDPKLSTILQVLLSIQAIIMSNEVYFNEPGYEHEQGTPEGEKKNEGYANIVRYCNVKFAMIDAIKNPPAGFEKVIKRSFYLKKNEILREVKEWVDRAKVTDATYTGLVYDHNYTWAPQISPEGKYAEMMEAIYKELQETLESIQSPFEDESGSKIERKFSEREDEQDKENNQEGNNDNIAQNTQIDDIDVTYDINETTEIQQQNINIDDEKVKDRWSRYIGAMGIEAVAKQAESRVLICGLGPLGVEIAKNIVLAGCKELILWDGQSATEDQLSGQFFLTQENTSDNKCRSQLCRNKIQELNYYVKVSCLNDIEDHNIHEFIEKTTDLKVVVITEQMYFTREQLYKINSFCRANKTALIAATQDGLFSRVFNDFGPEFIVLDKDGEDLQEVMIQDISYKDDPKIQASVVTLLPGFKHRYQDGDKIVIKEVNGMRLLADETKNINNSEATIKVINPQSFTIDIDVREYSPYEGNGIAKQIKVPVKVEFKTLEELDKEKDAKIDSNLAIYDFEKMDNLQFMHHIYESAVDYSYDFKNNQAAFPIDDIDVLYNNYVLKRIPNDLSDAQKKKLYELYQIFFVTSQYKFPPICAFIGGVVTQEIVKAITQKYMPINQYFYFDTVELFPINEIEQKIKFFQKFALEGSEEIGRYFGLEMILGKDLVNKIHQCKLFMIGAGAIGCELLKNYAMLGLGSGKDGQIILTDPDVIEVSNLNRQFLFREKHLRKPKSQTAAAAAIQMNPDLKNHIQARLDKIHDGTANIYNEAFFKKQTIVTNALDNVAARLYIDGKCVAARVPLIDSGTLGPKGHVQIVLPGYKTESYASQNDPEDNNEIPHCTLKMFPEEILHCIEWAKDIFGNQFTLKPQSYNKLVEQDAPVNFSDQQELVTLKKVLKTIEKKPASFEDCIKLARARFQKHFVNDIKQLLHVYPLDKQTKEGRPFWSLPKRPPHPVEFDPENATHASFVASTSCLIANAHKIKIPYEEPRSTEAKKKIAQLASTFEQAPFVPNDQKASEIESQVEKDQNKQSNQDEIQQNQEQEQAQPLSTDVETIIARFQKLLQPLRSDPAANAMAVEEFEKDNDQNFHIDFIHSMANIRAANYNLEEMDWINVKIKAGRIVPALATTTAAIAGLQTIELLKYLKNCKLEEHRNSFMNLAVPSLMMSEPGPALKTTLKEGLEVTLWDRWEYDATTEKEVTLLKIIEQIEKEKNLLSRDVFYGSVPVFMHALQGKDQASRTQALNKPLLDLIHGVSKDKVEFIDLTITFTDPEKKSEDGNEKKLDGVPIVRVIFKK